MLVFFGFLGARYALQFQLFRAAFSMAERFFQTRFILGPAFALNINAGEKIRKTVHDERNDP